VVDLSVGDVVIATETVEHDIRNRFGPPQMPRFEATVSVLDRCRELMRPNGDFVIHYAAIANGDEDVVDDERRAEVRCRTGVVAVRGISDGADSSAAGDFVANLPLVMRNVVSVVVSLAAKNDL
jgi:adenosylhomocysteine nucleosidase